MKDTPVRKKNRLFLGNINNIWVSSHTHRKYVLMGRKINGLNGFEFPGLNLISTPTIILTESL